VRGGRECTVRQNDLWSEVKVYRRGSGQKKILIKERFDHELRDEKGPKQ